MAGIVGGLVALVVAVSVLESAYQPSRSPYGTAILESRPAGYWNLGEFRGPQVHDALAGRPPGRFQGAIGFGTHGAMASSPDTAVQLDARQGAIVLGTPAPEAQSSSLAFFLRPDEGAAHGALNSAGPAPPWIVASQTTRALAWKITFEVPDRLSVIYRTPSETLREVSDRCHRRGGPLAPARCFRPGAPDP